MTDSEIKKLPTLAPRPIHKATEADIFNTAPVKMPEPILIGEDTATLEALEALTLKAAKPVTAKAKMSYYLDKGLIARYKNAYNATAHLTGVDTTSEFVAEAIRQHVTKLEEEFNGGEAFSSLNQNIPRGRRGSN